jgi:energy-coupling factor transporter transmembrane protein EcfT
VPGSPESDESKPKLEGGPPAFGAGRRPLHPGAALAACAAAGLALSLVHSIGVLAAAAAVLLAASLRVEGRALRGELPLLLLALIVFAAHLLLGGRPPREALRPAGEIALRLLALLYLTRWAARAVLPRAARWLFTRTGPRRPRAAALLFESGRTTLALLPLALGEAERQHLALRARAVRPGRGLAGRARYLAAWLLPYLGTMLRVGDAYGEALHVRGYALGSPRRAGASYRWGAPEAALVLGSALAAAWLVRVR